MVKNKNAESLGAVHTHTHTHTHFVCFKQSTKLNK